MWCVVLMFVCSGVVCMNAFVCGVYLCAFVVWCVCRYLSVFV